MASSKYKFSLILFLIYEVIMIAFPIVLVFISGPENSAPPMFSLIPYPNFTIELIVTFTIIIPLAAIIGAFLAGFIFTPLFLGIHKLIVGKKMVYGIQERKEKPEFSTKKIFQSFFPGLMAINFALLFNTNETVYKFILKPENWTGDVGYVETYFPAFIVLLMFTIIIAMALFSSIWFLEEAGMVFSNEKDDKNDTEIVEIKSVGGFYKTMLSGYAGIGVMFSFYMFVLLVIFEIFTENFVLFIVIIILFLSFPLLIILASIPAMIILDRYKGIRNRFVLWLGRRNGIKDQVEVKLIKLDQEEIVQKKEAFESENNENEINN